MAEDEPLAAVDEKQERTVTQVVYGEGVSAFESKKFDNDDLHILGIDENDAYYRIEFINDKSISYLMCSSFLASLITSYVLHIEFHFQSGYIVLIHLCFLCVVVLWPFWILFSCCIYYGVKTHVESRKAALTNSHLIMHSGFYGCCCIFWNESTKSVPLEKITDLAIKQGCVNACFDIKEITVDTASVTQETNELKLIGVTDPEKLRKKVLQIRDRDSQLKSGGNAQQIALRVDNNREDNPLLGGNKNEQVTQTLVEIKDLLVSMNDNIANLKSES